MILIFYVYWLHKGSSIAITNDRDCFYLERMMNSWAILLDKLILKPFNFNILLTISGDDYRV